MVFRSLRCLVAVTLLQIFATNAVALTVSLVDDNRSFSVRTVPGSGTQVFNPAAPGEYFNEIRSAEYSSTQIRHASTVFTPDSNDIYGFYSQGNNYNLVDSEYGEGVSITASYDVQFSVSGTSYIDVSTSMYSQNGASTFSFALYRRDESAHNGWDAIWAHGYNLGDPYSPSYASAPAGNLNWNEGAQLDAGVDYRLVFRAGSPSTSGIGQEAFASYNMTGTISTVPVPAAVWLFGSALTALGWLRRKQTA